MAWLCVRCRWRRSSNTHGHCASREREGGGHSTQTPACASAPAMPARPRSGEPPVPQRAADRIWCGHGLAKRPRPGGRHEHNDSGLLNATPGHSSHEPRPQLQRSPPRVPHEQVHNEILDPVAQRLLHQRARLDQQRQCHARHQPVEPRHVNPRRPVRRAHELEGAARNDERQRVAVEGGPREQWLHT
jgi:hypothetical protein